jgi:predicted nucleic acid-binding protein
VSKGVIIDTGPLVAFLAEGSEHGNWVTEQFKRLRPPLLTCEAVLTEAAFLLKREGAEADKLFALLERGVLRLSFTLGDQEPDVRELMRRYRDTPMSLADACLVRMAELHAGGTIFTLDGDFRVYRKHGRQIIPVLMPGD